MKKQFLVLFIFSVNQLIAQHSLTGRFIQPTKPLSQVILYGYEHMQETYITNAKIKKDGTFVLVMPKTAKKGMYRLYYEYPKHIDFVYNQDNISFTADATKVLKSIVFNASKENTLYFAYLKTINALYLKLDALQKTYYEQPTKALTKDYKQVYKTLVKTQAYYEHTAKETITCHFIKGYQRFWNATPVKNKKEYNALQIKNAFVSINFKDKLLQNTPILLSRIKDYVFSLNAIKSRLDQTELDTKMVDDVLEKCIDYTQKNSVKYALTLLAYKQSMYNSIYDGLLDYLFNTYYVQLPIKNNNLTQTIQTKLQTIVGKKTPNIQFKTNTLYDIVSKRTLLIFWSSTCSHCLKKLPILYKKISNKTDLKVIMLGIETDDNSNWQKEIKKYPKWQHKKITDTGKYVKQYNITHTPTFFLLDEDKIIISKPNTVSRVMSYEL